MTTAAAYKISRIAKTEFVAALPSMPQSAYTIASTPRLIEYTDAQFYDDIEKAENIDNMAAQALKDHKRGKTRKFPE